LIGLGLAGAGAASNYVGAQRTNDAREDVALAEGDRQRNIQGQATDIIDQQTSKLSPAAQNQSLAQTAERRTSALVPSQDFSADLPTSGSAPIQVKGEVARQMANAIRSSRGRLGAQARLGAFRQNHATNQLGTGRAFSALGALSDRSQGSASVLPYELAGAANAGRGYRNAADLFNLASNVVSLYGMTRAPQAPGAAPAAPRAPAAPQQSYVGPRAGY
jgi:hypothetical protein